MPRTLPEQKSGINKRFASQKISMIGASGIGKSAFFAQDPKAFFIETEAGLNFEDVFKMPARDWTELREVYNLLYERAWKGDGSEFPYDIVVIDTIDKVINYAEAEVIEWANGYFKKEVHSIRDVPEGAGWDRRKKHVKRFLDGLEMLPCAKAYIGHVEVKEIKDMVLGKYSKKTISIGGKMGGDLLAWTDHTLHVEALMVGEELKRTVYTKPTQSREAKSRGGIVPDGVVWGNDSGENYRKFRELFD